MHMFRVRQGGGSLVADYGCIGCWTLCYEDNDVLVACFLLHFHSMEPHGLAKPRVILLEESISMLLVCGGESGGSCLMHRAGVAALRGGGWAYKVGSVEPVWWPSCGG